MLSPSGAGSVVGNSSTRGDLASSDADRQPTNSGTSDEIGEVSAGYMAAGRAEPELRREAHRLVQRLQIEPPWETRPRRGGADIAGVSWDGRGGDIDVDRVLGSMVPGQILRDDEIYVRRPMTHSRSVVLLIDVSGSMKGERLATAAATIGSLASGLANDTFGVTAFWSDAAVVVSMGERLPPAEVLDLVLDIDSRGLTNLGFGLTTAMGELDGWPSDASRIVLLSDCVHNAGPDPRPLAVGGPRIDVLVDVSEEYEEMVARDLARTTGGRCEFIANAADVRRALPRLFDS